MKQDCTKCQNSEEKTGVSGLWCRETKKLCSVAKIIASDKKQDCFVEVKKVC